MKHSLTLFFLYFITSFVLAQPVYVLWDWKENKVKKLEQNSVKISPDENGMATDLFMMQVPFSLSIDSWQQKVDIKFHNALKVVKIDALQILKSNKHTHVVIKHEIKEGKLISLLLQTQLQEKTTTLDGVVTIHFGIDLKKLSLDVKLMSRSCFKCGGDGKKSAWCGFCHLFVAWCRHGKKTLPCDGCSQKGVIASNLQRCPKCMGSGHTGRWCNSCHGHMAWCVHGAKWVACSTCKAKGAISMNYTFCLTCRGRGHVGPYCKSCRLTVAWCRHGIIKPRSCPNCKGKGVR